MSAFFKAAAAEPVAGIAVASPLKVPPPPPFEPSALELEEDELSFEPKNPLNIPKGSPIRLENLPNFSDITDPSLLRIPDLIGANFCSIAFNFSPTPPKN